MKRSLLALCLGVSVFTGCYDFVDGGPITSETRTLEPFDAVRVDDGLRVTVRQGSAAAELVAPEKVLPVLDTRVEGGVLRVTLRPGITVTTISTIAVTVSSEAVRTVEANQGADVDATGLSGAPLRLTATGGSHVTASGTTDDLRVSASGGAVIDAAKVTAAQASVDASGGAEVQVNATAKVEGTASGGSVVTVTGGADTSRLSLSGGSTLK